MARANLIYEGTFEGGTPFTNIIPQSAISSEITASTDFAKAGTKSAKIILNKTDADIGNSKRSEINRGSTLEPAGAFERWYGVSFYLPTDYVTDTAPEAIIQWHEYSGTASPHFALWTMNNHFWIVYDGIATVDLGVYTKNVWNDFVFHMRWNSTSSGTFDAWYNGAHVVNNKTGANMPVDTHGPYLKTGIYKWYWKKYPTQSQTTQRILYIDELRIGNASATYEDVVPTQTSNVSPIANAGADKVITSPASTTTLVGSATDSDGTIATYAWTKDSGTGGAITTPAAATTGLTGLSTGSYVYRLTVTDNLGATAFDTVNVTVLALANVVPVVDAGVNKTITLPTSTVNLSDATATDSDGTIATYAWTKVSGTGGTITTPTTLATTVTGLTAGVYVFKLTVTDNGGATANDIVTVTVNPVVLNVPPLAIAGADHTMTLPTNSTTLVGSGTDSDGTIASYLWTQLSGTGGTIVSPTSATTNITGLAAGIYYFQLRVTDNGGLSAIDKVRVTVNAAPRTYRGFTYR